MDPQEPSSGDRDPWLALSRFTSARIAMGRAGGSLRTGSLLDFRLSHARARDAVQSPFDAGRVERQFAAQRIPVARLETRASDRTTYLARPDFGRVLTPDSRKRVQAAASEYGRRDLVVLVSDGLAAHAAERHAFATVSPLLERLRQAGWTFYPLFVVPLARVKLQDEVGEILGARHALILLGERPGLGSPDSLGAYFTFEPRSERTDADRNCVSNIRPEGLPPADAALKIARLLRESARRELSGIALKDRDLPPLEVPS